MASIPSNSMETSDSVNNGDTKEGKDMNRSQNGMDSSDDTKLFTLKKWNLVGLWSWDVECDTCAICRTNVMDPCLRCQNESRTDDCVVVWGECGHVYHNCCMGHWVKKNNRCPLCQNEWAVKHIGK